MTLSVICPIYNEERHIKAFLNSVLQQDYPKDDLEILLVDGKSTDRTRNIISAYSDKYPFIRLIDNPQQTVPFAMNYGIRNANGDIIIRLDAHAVYPVDYFSILLKYLECLEGAENVGGVCETLPCNNTATAISIAECLSNPFGMGNSYFRIGTDKVMSVDTVPFGCFRRSLFDRIGLYDTDMIRNQDDELNGRIIKSGGKIYLLPKVKIKYYARDKIAKVRKMFYQYGLYKPLGNKKLGAPATMRQFVPVLFLFGLISGFFASCFFPILRVPYLLVLLIYTMVGIIEGLKSAQKTLEKKCIVLMPYVFLNIHLSYGYGYMIGLYKILFHRKLSVLANR